jgi:hypothetical protein
LSPRIHPVGHRGVEPRATALSERPLHRLGSGQREVEVPTLYGLTAAHRHSKPAPAPAGHLPLRQWTSDVRHRSWRIAEVPPPNACAPTRVRAGGCSSAASLSTADGPGVEPAPFHSANLPSRLRADSHRRKPALQAGTLLLGHGAVSARGGIRTLTSVRTPVSETGASSIPPPAHFPGPAGDPLTRPRRCRPVSTR